MVKRLRSFMPDRSTPPRPLPPSLLHPASRPFRNRKPQTSLSARDARPMRQHCPRWGVERAIPLSNPLTLQDPPRQERHNHQRQHHQYHHKRRLRSVVHNGSEASGRVDGDVFFRTGMGAARGREGGGGEGGGVGRGGENAAAAGAAAAGAEGGRAGREGEPAARKRFRGLLADRFQHPFDLVRMCCRELEKVIKRVTFFFF